MLFHVHSSVTTTDSEAGTFSGPKASTGSPSGSNQAELTRLHYIYDAWNRLTYVKTDSGGNPGTTLATYVCDDLNRPIDESNFNENWQALEVRRNADVDPREQYTWHAGYIDTSIFNELDVIEGQVEVHCAYDPYGRRQSDEHIWTKVNSSAKDNSILYGGYVFDAETNNYYARNRYLQPTMGKWTQRDFAGYVDGGSLYQYVKSNPLTSADSYGFQTKSSTLPSSQPTKPTVDFLDPNGTNRILNGYPVHDRSTCPTCNSSDPKRDRFDAIVVDENAKNATNCIGWAMNGAGQAFMAHLGMGMKDFDNMLKADDAAKQVRAHLDKILADDYGGTRLQNENDECPCGTHKIGVYYRNLWGGKDVHMITQHTDGSWSGKPSFDKPVIAQTPQDVMKTTNGWGSSVELIGFYCVKGPPRCKQ